MLLTASTAFAQKLVDALAVKVDVVIVLPEPAVNTVAADALNEHPESLYKVTVAASDRVMVSVGVWVAPSIPGEIDV